MGANTSEVTWRRSLVLLLLRSLVLNLVIMMYCSSNLIVQARSGQETLLALCTAWDPITNTCPLQSKPHPIQNFFVPGKQQVCKAQVAVVVQQTDWQGPLGGLGHVQSVSINAQEMLPHPVFPSQAYFAPIFPKCDDWYQCFAPWGNVAALGMGTRQSVLELAALSNSIQFDVQFVWTGPHLQHPVCSMNGVSYAAMARLDFYYEVQENSLCPGWNPSNQTVCHDQGSCNCAITDGLARACTCKMGYAAPTCEDCSVDHFGATCQHVCEACQNGGRCMSGKLGSGLCNCAPGFDPLTRCATCLPHHFGPSCLPCPDCHHPGGNCVDGITGNGECACAVGFDPSLNCAECRPSFYGPQCTPCDPCGEENGGVGALGPRFEPGGNVGHVGKGHCNHGRAGDGQCTCLPGFEASSRCTQCLPGHFGEDCWPCESCHGRGVCNETIAGDGTCLCDEGYTSESRCIRCSVGWDFNPTLNECDCAPEHFGEHCLSCPICAPHGKCNAGRDGDGSCICEVGWSDSNNCVGCMVGYYGFNCQPCQHCYNGKCDDGLRGTGLCVCHRGWDAAADCLDCSEGYFGPDCALCPMDCGHGSCNSGINGTGACECDVGWELHASSLNAPQRPCTTCAKGYFGAHCKSCPGLMVDGAPCNRHGLCQESNGTALCICDARYTGLSCEKYEFPIATIGILVLIALSTLGFCMCTMRRLANQTQHDPYGPRRRFSRADYVEISEMADLELFVSSDSKDWLIPFESLTLQYEVGNGTSGQVFRSLYHSGGGSSTVAVKRLYSPITGQEYFQNFFRREVSILSRLHHPNVVRFYGVSYYSRILYIVTDFCPTSLSDVIDNPNSKGPLEQSFFVKIITQITSGIGFLHSRNVVHRDLKPANVLLNDTQDVNICDFGLSRLIDVDMTSMTAEVGTPSYMAPEMATMGGIQCSTKGDVYSFGILLYSLWTRSKPYGDQGMNPFQLMTAVVNGLRPVIPINCPPGLATLMQACWDAHPDLRPTFPEISLQLKDETLLSMPEDDPPKVLGKSGDFGGGKHHTQVHLRKKMDVSFADAKAPLLSPHSVLETKLSPSTSTSTTSTTSTTTYGTIAATATATSTPTPTGLATAILPASDELGEEENDSLLSDGDEAMPS